MGYRPDISVYNKSQYDDYNTKSSNVGLGLAALGLGSELLQKSLIDNKAKTWYDWSRMTYGDAKVRSLSYTGSPLSTSKTQIARYNAFASNLVTSKTLSIAGKGLGAYNALDLINQRRSGQIGDFQFFAEQGSNAFSTLGGIPGAAWGVGWEAGRHISKKKCYHKYIYLHHNPGGRDGLLSTYK